MTKLTITEPEVGQKNSVADPRIPTALKEIEKIINGELEGTNNFKAEGILEANLEKALQEKIAAKVSGLEVAGHAVSFEAKSGEMCELNAALTVTLPAATANRLIGCYQNVVGVSTINAEEKGFKISGDFVNEVASIKLARNQHVWLFASGGKWLIVSGEPKREQEYVNKTFTKAECEAGVEPSKTRPALVSLKCGGATLFEVNGKAVITAETTTVWVQAAQKWKTTLITEAGTMLL